ncbi:VOC family protein [Planctobacterium marinum]|uniref:Glyoxalase n=1 Tax=Planctobacterium marinum TaxID=1631968 RepID=A0AA48KQR1_9ALTE|nr:glyoxalase [Planctobacterium marinum]
MLTPFHLAIAVHDLELARAFYGDLLGCKQGRSSEFWIDWDFWGHQLVTHLDQNLKLSETVNLVDGKDIGVPHFGVVLNWSDWEELISRLREKQVKFVLEPYVRFAGKPGEQGTFFIKDGTGNRLEFKAFKDPAFLFAKQ